MSGPTHRVLSLGAAVQSSTGLLLAARGETPTFDAAILLDTGWEPAAVYQQAHRLNRIAGQAGIPLVRVSAGHIRCGAFEWADAVAFDKAIRHGSARANADGHPPRGRFFPHRQRVPLDQVILRIPARAGSEGDAPWCGPWTCPHLDESPRSATEAVAASVREVA
jgi:hypothetical protein